MASIKLGSTPITKVMLGTTPITKIMLGTTLVWSSASSGANGGYDGFNIEGILINWVHELFGDDTKISDGLTNIITTSGDNIGSLVAYLDARSDYLGGLRSANIQTLRDDICGGLQSVGGNISGLSTQAGKLENGIIGFINGLPIVGHQMIEFIKSLPDDIDQIVGTIPVIGNLAIEIGLIPKADGTQNDPKNYIVDELGNVIGFLTCDANYSPKTGDPSEAIQFALGTTAAGQGLRMLIPDGLMSLAKQTQRVRFGDGTSAGDDGFLETVVSSVGDIGYVTEVFRRYSNDGSGANGVGIKFTSSVASIVALVSGTVGQVSPGVAYSPGDTFHLDQTGNVHTLVQNGLTDEAQVWTDIAGSAAKGANYRSLGLIMEGAKELLGSRLFSPSLDSVQFI